MLDVRHDSKPKTNVLFASNPGMIAINFAVEFLLFPDDYPFLIIINGFYQSIT